MGLTCGGILDAFVEPVSRESFPELGEVAESVAAHEPVAVVTVVAGPDDRLGRRLVIWPDRESRVAIGRNALDPAARAPSARAGRAQAKTVVEQVAEAWTG